MTLKIDKIAQQYEQAFKENGRTPKSVFCPKGRQELRYSKMLAGLELENHSILDFGSGLAHLYEFLSSNIKNFQYVGVDICDDFLADCQKRFPSQNSTFLHLNDFKQLNARYDYTISVGTFNLEYHEDPSLNWKFITESLNSLWDVTDEAMILNWMTDRVDFKQEGAFHLAPEKIIDWGCKLYSKRFLIDQSYMPYEYHITFFKDSEIDRTSNVYKAIS